MLRITGRLRTTPGGPQLTTGLSRVWQPARGNLHQGEKRERGMTPDEVLFTHRVISENLLVIFANYLAAVTENNESLLDLLTSWS